MAYLQLAIAILAEVVATTCLKQSNGLTRPIPSLVTAIGYLVAFYCLSLTLRTIPTAVAYTIWSAFGIVLIAAAAWIFQGQRLNAQTLVGMGIVVLGVVVMNGFTPTTPR